MNPSTDAPYWQYRREVRNFHEGRVSDKEFEGFFDLFDEDPRYPSLGVYIVVRFPYLVVFHSGAREWMRKAGALVFMDRVLREEFEQAMDPSQEYANEASASAMLKDNWQIHKAMIRAMLMFHGLMKARNWERITGFGGELSLEYCLMGGELSLGHILLDHLKEGPLDDIRALMGGNPEGSEFDGSNLVVALGPYLKAAAAVCATRVPELFLYRGRCFRLPEDHLNVLCLLIREDAGYSLREDQKLELVNSDRIPADARDSFRRCWRI